MSAILILGATSITPGAGKSLPFQLDANGNLKVVTSGATGASAGQVQGNSAAGATDSGNPVKIGAVYNATMPGVADGQRVNLQATSTGDLLVFPRLKIQTGVVGAAAQLLSFCGGESQNLNTKGLVMMGSMLHNGGSTDLASKATTASRIASCAATTNATSGKASAGTVHSYEAYNTTAAVKYLKLYNKASAPTVGTDTPVRTIAIPPNGRVHGTFPSGFYMGTGIAYALTGAAADADTTALAAGDVVGLNIDYN